MELFSLVLLLLAEAAIFSVPGAEAHLEGYACAHNATPDQVLCNYTTIIQL